MTKQYLMGEVKAAADDPTAPNGAFEVILSAPTLDRDGEVVDSKIFEPLPEHITFDIDHGMSVATTVASGVPSYDDQGRLIVKGTFSSIPRAQEVRTLVKEGHIRTTSVAFMNAKREEKDGVPHVTSAELLNGAFVPIPANRESVVLSAKSYREALDVLARPVPVLAVARKGHGMTANDLRDVVGAAVRKAYDGPERWVWVRDYDDEMVVFYVEDESKSSTYRQTYTVKDRAAALTGAPEEVRARTVYDPISTESTATAPAPAVATLSVTTAKAPAAVSTAKARTLLARAAIPR